MSLDAEERSDDLHAYSVPMSEPLAPLPLAGRTALITGVSRKRGIGYALASRLASLGASLAVHHHRPHDVDEYGAADDLGDLLTDLRAYSPLVRESLTSPATSGTRRPPTR